jgi:hypothetical protein
MRFLRSFFFALLVSALTVSNAIPALAADNGSSPPPQPLSPAMTEGALTQQSAVRTDLLSGETQFRPIGPLGTTVLNDGVCYTMRMYKVKRTERLAAGERASLGYATCELASNFQVRSAVAHVDDADARPARSQPKQKK